MIAKKLRNSVLQLAVQGRLVPQDPADEPASVLLEKIRAEKRALVRAGKLRKDRAESTIFRGSSRIKGTEAGRFYEKDGAGKIADITDVLPFAIPESWEWVRLGQVVKSLTDGTHLTPKYVDSSGVPFLSVKNISSGKVDFSNCKYITEDEHRILYKRCNPEFGDILLTKVGTTGIPVLVDTKREFSLFVSVALIKIFSHLLSSKFMVFELQSPLVQEQARINTKGVGNKNWVMRDIAKTLLPLPPLAEQERIVSALDALLPKISEYEESETKIHHINISFPEKLKKSVLQAAVQGQLVPQDPADEPASVLLEKVRANRLALIRKGKIKKPKFESVIFKRDGSWFEKCGKCERCIDEEIPFKIPDNWTWERIGNIGSFIRGFGIRRSDVVNKGVGCIRYGEIYTSYTISFSSTNSFVDPDLAKGLKIVNKNDLLFTLTGETKEEIGKTIAYTGEKEIVAGGDLGLYKFHGQNAIYLSYFMDTPYALQKKALLGTGNIIVHISCDKLASILCPIPPLAEQNRIVSAIGDILTRISPLSGPNEKFSVGL